MKISKLHFIYIMAINYFFIIIYIYGVYMTQSFDSWTDYNDWLIANYVNYNIYKVNEINGKIEIEYCNKGDLDKIIAQQKENAN